MRVRVLFGCVVINSGMCGNTTDAEALDAAQEATTALSFGDQGSSASSRQSKDRRKRERKQAETFALAAARARRVSQTTLVTKGTIKAAQNWKRRTGVGKLPSVEVPPAPAIDISQAVLFSESVLVGSPLFTSSTKWRSLYFLSKKHNFTIRRT